MFEQTPVQLNLINFDRHTWSDFVNEKGVALSLSLF